jgi:hypothetical protein
MARINIEEKLFADARFVALCNKVSRREAIGMMVDAWLLAQKHWLKDHKYIPEQEFLMAGLEPLIECFFAQKMDSGYYIKGSEDQFGWLKKRQEDGKKGGKRSVEARLKKYGKTSILRSKHEAPLHAPFIDPSCEMNPLTLTLTPTLNTYTSNKPSVHKGDDGDEKDSMANAIVNVWNQTLTSVLPPVSKLTDKRKKLLNAQLKKYPDIEHWQQACDKVKASDFLTGRASDWKCNFDWVLNENNRTKILEGNYDNKGSSNFYKEPERRWLEIPTGDKQ